MSDLLMDKQQELQIARGLRQGSVEAWNSLYDAYARRVCAYIAPLMEPNSTEVADVVQETFLAAARSAKNFDPARGSLWHWLSGIARNRLGDHNRQKRRGDPIAKVGSHIAHEIARWLDGGKDPQDALASAETAAMVRQTLAELSSDYGTLLTEKYCHGAPVDEIAQRQGCSATAIRSRLARARQAFRAAFGRTGAADITSDVEGRS